MQSWTFNSRFWNKTRVQAFLSGVPIVLNNTKNNVFYVYTVSYVLISGSFVDFRPFLREDTTFYKIFFLFWSSFYLEHVTQFRGS